MTQRNGDFLVEVDWDGSGDPGTGTGEDITSRVLRMRFFRGRDFPATLGGRSIASKATITLNNESGDYSSFNTGSPITGLVKPGRLVRIKAGSGAFPYDFPFVFSKSRTIFQGFLSSLKSRQISAGTANLATLTAIGPLGHYNRDEVRVPLVSTITTGAAIDDILDQAGVPAGDRSIDTGLTTMRRYWSDTVKPLTALRGVEDTEAGFILESREGKIVFQDRQTRLTSPATTSQATFSDAAGAALTYRLVDQEDPLSLIYNRFRVSVDNDTVQSIATLWTLSEVGSSSPTLAPAEAKTFWANFPNAASNVAAWFVETWTTPAITTDYLTNTASDGSGVNQSANVTIAVAKFPNAMQIKVTNTAGVPVFLTKLQARGTEVRRDDRVWIDESDAASITAFGESEFESKSRHIPTTAEALDWSHWMLSRWSDEVPILKITFDAWRSNAQLHQALVRDIGDRITLVATNASGLGINEDFFIESMLHNIDPHHGHTVSLELSPTSGFSQGLVLDTDKLDTGVLTY